MDDVNGLEKLEKLCKGPPSFGTDPRAPPPSLVGDRKHHERAEVWWMGSRERHAHNMRLYHHDVQWSTGPEDAHYALGRAVAQQDGIPFRGLSTTDLHDIGREHLLGLHGTEDPLVGR